MASDLEAVFNMTNGSSFGLEPEFEPEQEPVFGHVPLFVLLTSFSLITVFGNVLVVTAVLRERTLHTATNYFITSLAVSDCLVGAVVMPFSASYEAYDQKV